jgi:hypothetical protein
MPGRLGVAGVGKAGDVGKLGLVGVLGSLGTPLVGVEGGIAGGMPVPNPACVVVYRFIGSIKADIIAAKFPETLPIMPATPIAIRTTPLTKL